MRVAHIESGRHLYGGARQVLYLIDELRGEGVESVLLCARGSAIGAAARGVCDVVEVAMHGDLDIGAARRLRAALNDVAPDIVHVHSRRGADVHGALATIGAPWRAVLTRRVDHREWAPWASWKYRRYAAVIAISRAVEAELIGHVGLPRDRVHLVPSGVPAARERAASNGIPLADERTAPSGTAAADEDAEPRSAAPAPARSSLSAELGLPNDARIAGVIAQLIPRKGHDVLLDALARALPRHPRWHVVLFGRGPLEARLRERIARLGLDCRVRLAGYRDDLSSRLRELDLVLHPALKEGLGLAVLEAMVAGVPVAASAAGGLPDAIEDGVSGVLVPPGDSRAWAAALERLFSDERLRARLGRSGRARAAGAFGVRRMVLGNLQVYRAVLSRAAERRRASPAPEERA